MTLELIPNGDLIFKGPFNVVSTTTLKLANSGNERLAYKIKTTAPKRYCVKPNSGFLESHANANIQVMLQPQAAGQPDDRTKHKFMVQWVAVPNTYTDDVDNFWKQDLKSLNVQDSKLKCVFADEQQAAVVPNDSHGHHESNASSSRIDVGDDPNKSRIKQEIDRLKAENENLKERLKQQESTLRQRPTGGESVSDRYKSTQQQQQKSGVVIFGVGLNEQLVLVAFIIALLFGFSLGYFLFSCGN
jgi:vesicle-associated membrane protein-associated protein A